MKENDLISGINIDPVASSHQAWFMGGLISADTDLQIELAGVDRITPHSMLGSRL